MPNNGQVAVPRGWSGLGSAVLLDPRPYTGGISTSGSDNALGAFPSEIDGELKLSRMYLAEQGSNKPPRAVVPGVFHIPQAGTYGLLKDGDTQAGSVDLAGRTLLMVETGAALTAIPVGVYAVDITGPWR